MQPRPHNVLWKTYFGDKTKTIHASPSANLGLFGQINAKKYI